MPGIPTGSSNSNALHPTQSTAATSDQTTTATAVTTQTTNQVASSPDRVPLPHVSQTPAPGNRQDSNNNNAAPMLVEQRKSEGLPVESEETPIKEGKREIEDSELNDNNKLKRKPERHDWINEECALNDDDPSTVGKRQRSDSDVNNNNSNNAADEDLWMTETDAFLGQRKSLYIDLSATLHKTAELAVKNSSDKELREQWRVLADDLHQQMIEDLDRLSAIKMDPTAAEQVGILTLELVRGAKEVADGALKLLSAGTEHVHLAYKVAKDAFEAGFEYLNPGSDDDSKMPSDLDERRKLFLDRAAANLGISTNELLGQTDARDDFDTVYEDVRNYLSARKDACSAFCGALKDSDQPILCDAKGRQNRYKEYFLTDDKTAWHYSQQAEDNFMNAAKMDEKKVKGAFELTMLEAYSKVLGDYIASIYTNVRD